MSQGQPKDDLLTGKLAESQGSDRKKRPVPPQIVQMPLWKTLQQTYSSLENPALA
jgi:hypothetical protein